MREWRDTNSPSSSKLKKKARIIPYANPKLPISKQATSGNEGAYSEIVLSLVCQRRYALKYQDMVSKKALFDFQSDLTCGRGTGRETAKEAALKGRCTIVTSGSFKCALSIPPVVTTVKF